MEGSVVSKRVKRHGLGLPQRPTVSPGRGTGLAIFGPEIEYTPQVIKASDEASDLSGRKLHVSIDIVNRCNLRCIMCHFTFDEVFYQNAEIMSVERFKSIAESIRPYTSWLTLSAAYEPTTSPFFAEILRVSSELGFDNVDFLTNGNSLSAAAIDAILLGSVKQVCFSVHAARPETYAKILRGGDINRAVANIKRLVDKRNQAGKAYPQIQFNIALMKSNVDELSEIFTLAAECGANSVAFRHLIVFEGLDIENESLSRHDKRLANGQIQAALERAKALKLKIFNAPDYFALDTHEIHSQWTDWSLPQCERLVAGDTAEPIGNFDLPLDHIALPSGSVELSGWALSYGGLHRVVIARDAVDTDIEGYFCDEDLISIGDASFHNATRNDVMELFPGYHYNYRAGWSYKLTAAELPDIDPLHIYAVAVLRNGGTKILGSRQVVRASMETGKTLFARCDKPFNSLYVDARGNAYPYPDCHTSHAFGVFDGQPFDQVWSSPAFVRLRRDLLAGNDPAMCVHCPLFINREVNDADTFASHEDFSSEAVR